MFVFFVFFCFFFGKESIEKTQHQLNTMQWQPYQVKDKSRMMRHWTRNEDGELVRGTEEMRAGALRRADQMIERTLNLNLDKTTIHLDFDQLLTPDKLLKSPAAPAAPRLEKGKGMEKEKERLTSLSVSEEGEVAVSLPPEIDPKVISHDELVKRVTPSFVSLTDHLDRYQQQQCSRSASAKNCSRELVKEAMQDEVMKEKKRRRRRRREEPNVIDWKKLEDHIAVVGWNEFAKYVNDDRQLERVGVPGFVRKTPLVRTTLDRPKAVRLSVRDAFKHYRVNEKVRIEPVKMEANGNVALLVNERHLGVIRKVNLMMPMKVGEFHTGFVREIGARGKIDVVLEHPNVWTRMLHCQQRIVDVVSYCGGSMDLDDKADADTILRVFEMSKKNFKRALGMLLKDKMVKMKRDPPSIALAVAHVKRRKLARLMVVRMLKSKPPWERGTIASPLEAIEPDDIKKLKAAAAQRMARKRRMRVSGALQDSAAATGTTKAIESGTLKK